MVEKVYEQTSHGNAHAWERHVGRSTKCSLELCVVNDNQNGLIVSCQILCRHTSDNPYIRYWVVTCAQTEGLACTTILIGHNMWAKEPKSFSFSASYTYENILKLFQNCFNYFFILYSDLSKILPTKLLQPISLVQTAMLFKTCMHFCV